MAATVYQVQGMTCAHCVGAVTSELRALEGVTEVRVDLNAGGISDVRVTSVHDLDEAVVIAAIDEAGYSLAD